MSVEGTADDRSERKNDSIVSPAGTSQISFSLGKGLPVRKLDTKPKETDQNENEDIVLEVSSGKFISSKPKKIDSPLVIPLSDGWKIPVGSQSGETEPVPSAPEAPSSKEKEPIVSEEGEPVSQVLESNKYGLIVLKSKRQNAENDATQSRPAPQGTAKPILLRSRPREWYELQNEEERLKFELENRPDDEADYERVPVDKFGEAALRGMGWTPGAPIGLTNKKVVDVIEFVPRPHRLALGAEPKLPEPLSKDKIIKPGESREQSAPMVYRDKTGKVKHIKSIDEKLIKLPQLDIGSLVSIVSGPHEGMTARVEKIGSNGLIVRLQPSDEFVAVDKDDVMLMEAQLSNGPYTHGRESPKQQTRGSESDRNAKRPRPDDTSSVKTPPPKRVKERNEDSSSSSKKYTVWVRPDIRVRIRSKKLLDGKLYCKKARVLDVYSGTSCSVQLEDSGKVVTVDQYDLETVIPQPGGYVQIVRGPRTGELARLLDKDSAKQTVQVQILDDLSILPLPMDDVAQYLGNVDDL